MKPGTNLFFCMIFVNSVAFCQIHPLKDSTGRLFINSCFFNPLNKGLNYRPFIPVSSKFYVNNLGFFCRQELKLQAVTRLPFKFRLGSLEYNDWMEGKINAGIKPVY